MRVRRRPGSILRLLSLAGAVALSWSGSAIGGPAGGATSDGRTPVAVPPPRGLAPGQVLTPGQSLAVRGFRLTLQPGGALVAEQARAGRFLPFWSNRVHSPGARLEMTPAGNLVELSSRGAARWSVGSSRPGSCVVASDTDGDPVVHYPRDRFGLWPLWTVAPCYAGNPSGPRVAVVGDSITWYTEPPLGRLLAPTYSYAFSGMPSFEMAQQLTGLDGLLHDPAGPPDDLVVELGTNDAERGDHGWPSALERILAAAGGRCTLLVNVAHHLPGGSGQRDAAARRIDRALARAAQRHANVHLVDWAGLLQRRPPPGGWLMHDGLHPNDAGQWALALALLEGLERHCGTAAPASAP